MFRVTFHWGEINLIWNILSSSHLLCVKEKKGKEGWIKKPDSCRHILKEIEKKLPPLPVIRAGRTKWAAACGWMWNVNRSWSRFLKLFTKPAAHHISLHRKKGNSPCLAPNRQLDILSRIIETFDSKQSPCGFKITWLSPYPHQNQHEIRYQGPSNTISSKYYSIFPKHGNRQTLI